MTRLVLALVICAADPTLRAAEPAIVSHVKLVSDKVPDFSSLEAWKKSVLKDGMSDEEKAMAIWRSVVSFQYQDSPPNEFLQYGNNVLDPLKMANVYGYSFCSVTSAHMQALARAAGLKARGWTVNAHVVPEIFWNDSWHLLDASLINYFPRADGQLASVEEIVAAVKGWLSNHPELKGNDAKLREFMRGGGWRKGPELLTRSPGFDENGWLPAATHGWYATMQEYDGSTLQPYEAGYSMGYAVNVQLRPGERLTRNWSNRGLHVDMDLGTMPGALTEKVGGNGGLRYAPEFGDLAPGRIGNGVHEYVAPLANAAFLESTLEAENVLVGADGVQVKDGSKSGSFVVRMPSAYVYLTGELTAAAKLAPGGKVTVAFSENHGLDWQPLGSLAASGEQVIDLKPHVLRRYDYRLRFTLEGAGTALEKMAIKHDIQHSQRPLPALAQGANEITFSSGPPEGTITLEGSTELKNKDRQLVFTDFHPVTENLDGDSLQPKGREGSFTFPTRTPGDLQRLRVHLFYRARDAKDAWEVQVSFDGGKTFRSAAKFTGPHVGMGQSVTVSDIPPGTREALVRFAGTQVNTLVAFNYRIDADYSEPRGGFRPVKTTYVWEEGGAEKRHEHIATKPAETYTIQCATKPTMKSLVVELADASAVPHK